MTLPPLPEPDGTAEANKVPHPEGGYEFDEVPAWSEALVQAYAQAAVLAEREACAKLCELHAVESQVIIDMTIDMSQHEVASLSCAAAIRARGE